MQFPLKVWRQYILPQQALTRFAGFLSHSKISWLKNYLISWFIKNYEVDLSEALESNPLAYASYHDFFIRRLKPHLRPIDPSPHSISSPCDGTICQIGKIEQDVLLQAKNRSFSLQGLLGSKQDAKLFNNGHYVTIYLAPKDYHRVHMPKTGTLSHARYIPGKLFSVNPLTTEHVDNLFARNERVVTVFETDGKFFALILIGAMIVGSIYTQWSGNIIPLRDKRMKEIHYQKTPFQHINLQKGEEMGYFSLGSTVILILAENILWEYDLSQNSRLVVGQKIGHLLP